MSGFGPDGPDQPSTPYSRAAQGRGGHMGGEPRGGPSLRDRRTSPGARPRPAGDSYDTASRGDGHGGFRPRRARRGLAIFVLVAALVLGVAGGAWAWVLGQIHPSGGGAAVTVEVPAGEGLSGLAPTLAKDGVIGNTIVFKGYLHTKGHLPTILAGAYVLHRHEPYSAILATLAKGPPKERLVIPEGFTLAQIAARVGQLPGQSAASFLAVARSGVVTSPYEPPGTDNLEGLLFPATYTFSAGTSDRAILQMMVTAFDQEAAAVGLSAGAAKLGITPYQAVIVASLVIEEAKLPGDMGKVAQVIYNRLKAGMKLQIDYTVIYALGGNAAALAGHSPANVATNSPYNTYVVTGLPPTPIASPGVAALDAALNPTPGPWLYYVVVAANGKEGFSATYAGQLANIAKAQAAGLPG